MSEWDFNDSGSQDPFCASNNEKQRKNDYAGNLNAGMMIVCFLAVAVVSFLIALAMKDVVRDFWSMGLTFAAPFAALMGSAMLVEHITDRMTPQCSRKAQMVCILVTVLAAFVIGCFAEVLHQPVIIQRAEPEYDYLIIQDKSGSMNFGALEKPGNKALHELVDQMENVNNVGIVAFGNDVVGEQEILPLDEGQRNKINGIIDIPISITTKYDPDTGDRVFLGDGTNFTAAMERAMKLVDRMPQRNRTMRMILVTDGDEESIGSFSRFNVWASRLNESDSDENRIELCAIQLGNVPMLSMVKEAVNKTRGMIYDKVQMDELAKQLKSLKNTIIIPEPVDTLKATYAGQTADGKPNTQYMILTCVLLIIQGILCGFALKIMFSVQGQFRFQTILSPAMGLLAFLLLNFGRNVGIAPAWLCEAIAFSTFGLVFMRENMNTGRNPARMKKTGNAKNAPAEVTETFNEDF